ncbi:MAG: DUF373 family protein [Methanophagales archaeon]|nr:DUF373 family protein [Methanophagales archaeon]
MESKIKKTLVICVDRDNDMGEKAGLTTPITGKQALLSAATKLALADPEESDINAIFEAIRIYDRLSSRGEDANEIAEVALITGDKRVGIESDRKIGREFDEVLFKCRADSAILVSDGAEDESIVPLIQSRVKIDSVRRVLVKQSEPLESTFYMIKGLLNDTRFSRTFLPPIGLILLLLAFSLLFGFTNIVIAAIIGIIGFYTILKGFGREDLVIELVDSVKNSLYSGKLSFVTYIVAFVLILAGTFHGAAGLEYIDPDVKNAHIIVSIVYFVNHSIWWYTAVAISPLIGQMINKLIEGGKIVKQWAILSTIIASGLVLWGGSMCIIWLNAGNYLLGYLTLFSSILGAITISFIGVKTSQYMRGTLIREKKVVVKCE